MGMFDWVNYGCKCPKCGELVDGFQSKDRDFPMCENVDPSEVRELYSNCKKCKKFLHFNVVVKEYEIVPCHKNDCWHCNP